MPDPPPSLEQALRPEHQYQDQDDERPDILPGTATELTRDVLGGQRLDDAEHQATDDGAVDVADTENRGGERLQTGQEAHPEVDVVVLEALRDPGDRRQHGTEGEGHHDDPVDVDTHQPGGVGILRHGLHTTAQRVRLMKTQSSNAHTTSAATVKIADRWMVTPPTSSAGPVTTSICGNGCAAWRSAR